MGCLYDHEGKICRLSPSYQQSPLSLRFSSPYTWRKNGSVHHKYCSSKTSRHGRRPWGSAPFAAARVQLNGAKGDLKTSLCCHMWFVYHKIQRVTVFRLVTETQDLPCIFSWHQPKQERASPGERRQCWIKSVSANEGLFPGVSALDCPVNTSCPHKKAVLLFSWSFSQHIGCNSLLCFCSLILNWWCDPLDFTRYNSGHSVWWDSEPRAPLPHWN